MAAPARVAFFPDCFLEINGVARTSAALDAVARRRRLPFLTIHAGPVLRDEWNEDGGRLQLPRSPLSLRLEADLWCDLLIWRHAGHVRRALAAFRPDVIHITGPNDLGQLGAWLAWRLGVPLVASWHTNVHEFAATRSARWLAAIPRPMRDILVSQIERRVLDLAMLLYKLPRVLLAPNHQLIALLERRTGRPTRLMRRGIDVDLFSPARRDVSDGVFRVGYVGRLSPEKNVRLLPEIERSLMVRSAAAFQFVIVGHGSERLWLEREMRHAEFTGVLEGASLARAYANMDAFVFPSRTDTYGLVVLEALACGTPAIVTPFGGPQSIIEPEVSGCIAESADAFADVVLGWMSAPSRHRAMRHAAREKASQSSWDRTFETVYQAYDEALAGRDMLALHAAARA